MDLSRCRVVTFAGDRDSDWTTMSLAKANVVPRSERRRSPTFRVVGDLGHPDSQRLTLEWGIVKNETADEALGVETEKRPDGRTSASKERGKALLRLALHDGPKPRAELIAQADANDINDHTLKRCLDAIGGRGFRSPEKNGPQMWALAKDCPTPGG